MKNKQDIYARRLSEATAELGYRMRSPSPTRPWPHLPGWIEGGGRDDSQGMVAEIVEQQWPVAFLREQIEQMGGEPHGRARIDLARQLVATFYDTDRIAAVFAGLQPEVQRFFEELVFNLRVMDLLPGRKQVLLLTPLQGPPQELYEELIQKGLLLSATQGIYAFPHSLIRHLPPLELPVRVTAKSPRPQTVQRARPFWLLTRLQQLLGSLQVESFVLRPVREWAERSDNYGRMEYVVPQPHSARKLRGSSQRNTFSLELLAPEPELSAESLHTWSTAFDLPEPAAEFLYHTLLAGGVARSGSPLKLEPRVAEQLVGSSSEQQLALLFSWYRSMEGWSAFFPDWRAERVKVVWQYRPYVPLQAHLKGLWRVLRGVVLEYLAFLPHEEWLATAEVAEPLARLLPEGSLQLPGGNLELKGATAGWRGFVERYLHAVISGPLHWLGLTDVVSDGRESVAAFRLLHLRELLWKQRETYPLPAREGKVRRAQWMEEERTLLLAPPLPGALTRQLLLWSRPAGVRDESLLYRIDLERLHAAFEAGETPESLAAGWQAGAGYPVPDPVRRWWEHWWGRYGRVRLYPQQAAIIAQDAFVLQELQVAVPALNAALLGIVNPRTALIDPQRVEATIAAMEQKGYLPKVEE